MKIEFRLYLITDRNRLDGNRSLITSVRQALKGGVRAVQLREKDLSSCELLKLACRMSDLTRQYNAKLFINDRFDVALAVGADGVHLTQLSIPTEAVRSTVKHRLLIGVSTHSLKEAREAERGGADFITLGPVYRTASKLRYGPPVGMDTLKKVTAKIRIPVFAIGGIRGGRIGDVMESGAFGVAMISEMFRADDIQKKAEDIIKHIKNTRSNLSDRLNR